MKKRIKRTSKKTKRKNAFKKLEKNVKRDLGNQVAGVVYNPPGEIKMSDALQEVMAPFMDEVETLAAMENLVSLGAMAWNITLLPPDDQIEQIKNLAAMMKIEPDGVEMLFALVNEMMQRKQALYPDVKRYIVSYEVEDLGDSWHVSVAATLSLQDQ